MPYYIAELGDEDKKYYVIAGDIARSVEKFATRIHRPDIFFFHSTPMDNAIPAYNFILSLRDVYPHRVVVHDSVCISRRDLAKIKSEVRGYIASAKD